MVQVMNHLLLMLSLTNNKGGVKTPTTKETTMNGMYQRDSNEAFTNAKSKGLDKPQDYMYMYSKDNMDFFKNINFRNYISFNQ